MKLKALRFLVCPVCRSDLKLAAVSRDGSEVLEGSLSCRGCGAGYAIHRGVPRFVDTSGYASAYAGSFERATKSRDRRGMPRETRDLSFETSPPRVVALGGGTGLPVVLEGLKSALRDRLTAIVTVADDGGSSGRLRRAFRVLAPGDARNCLLALAEGPDTLSELFRFRFRGNGDVSGHSLGNLILTALCEVEGNFARAVERASEILQVRGRVLASTLEPVRLVAELENGSVVEGESAIPLAGSPIRRVHLSHENAAPPREAADALRAADLIILGPGSLYTSLIPNLLVRGLVEAIAQSNARVVLVMNLMTEPGETDGYAASDHVRALLRHAPGLVIDDVLVNSAPIGHDRSARYAERGAVPVRVDAAALASFGCSIVERQLFAEGPRVRHDARRLARVLLDLAAEGPVRGETTARLPSASGF